MEPLELPAITRARRSAWQTAREHATNAAKANALHTCPYRHKSWRSFWFRIYTQAKQLTFPIDTHAGETRSA